MHMPLTRRINTTIIFLFLITGCLADSFDKNIPIEWDVDFENQSIEAIFLRLGDPKDNASAKGFFNWIKYDKNYFKMLKIICSRQCDPNEKPSLVLFYVYKNGSSTPVYSKKIFPH